ncbi:uncharacterized protein LOC118882542 isoform X1 [Balaenoptera musculus]|uniref:Uncharacterized protein LOC118882542 isoform X1 n=1 Tax=Balaenoptera musculus TaxID=9771 RepID=A0A8B8VHI1_BALMU|nr:uncharacterized protein LOC118882542 isoform X1 [Balaenoptera musculus]
MEAIFKALPPAGRISKDESADRRLICISKGPLRGQPCAGSSARPADPGENSPRQVGDSQRPPCDRKERCHRHQPVLGLPSQVAGALPPPLPRACSHFLYWSSPRRPGRGVSCSSGQLSQSQVLLRWNRECLVTGEPQARAMGQKPRFLQSQCPERKDVRAGVGPGAQPGPPHGASQARLLLGGRRVGPG